MKSFINTYKIASLILGLLFILSSTISQERFNVRYDSDFPSTNFRSVIELEDGYLCTGFLTDSVISSGRPSIYAKFDFNGSYLFHKHHGGEEPNQNRFFSAQNPDFQFLNDNIILHSGVTYDENSIRQGYIMQLNLDGDTLNMFRYYSPNSDQEWPYNSILARKVEQSTDGNFLMLSSYLNPGGTGNDILIQKYTPSGELLWNYEYITEQDPDNCNVILPTNDGGVILIPTIVIDEFPLQFHHVIKLDSNGDEEWSFQTNFQVFAGTFTDAILEEDKIIASSLAKEESELFATPSIIKLDTLGNLIWQTKIWENDYDVLHKTSQLIKSGDEEGYIIGGNHGEWITDAPNESNGFLAKVSNDGELLWERKYQYFDLYNDVHQLYDLRATSDGGYIFCGEARGTDEDNPDVTGPYQQGWLVKVDEYGCLVEGCQQYDSISETEAFSEVDYFKLGSNPTSDFLNIFQIANTSPLATYTIYDLNGKEIKSIPAPDSGTTLMVDVSILATGRYILSLTEHRKVLKTEKIVIE